VRSMAKNEMQEVAALNGPQRKCVSKLQKSNKNLVLPLMSRT
jgi:hypothetical protein